MKNIIYAILLGIFFNINTQAEELPEAYYGKYTGKIDKYPIEADITKIGERIYGNYHYKSSAKPLSFIYSSSIDSNNVFNAFEYDETNMNNDISGIFLGKVNEKGRIEGKWSTPDSSKEFNFELSEDYSDGAWKVDVFYEHDKYYVDPGDEEEAGAEFLLAYPIIKDKKVGAEVNYQIFNTCVALNLGDSDKAYDNVDDIKQFFFDEYKSFYQDMGEFDRDDIPGYMIMTVFNVMVNTKDLMVLEYDSYQYTGGAHGLGIKIYYNYDMRTAEKIDLYDILDEDGWDEFIDIAEEEFAKIYCPSREYEECGFWFEDNKFAINDNIAFYYGGFLFKYNPYEIGPYAMGQLSFFLPYEKVEHLIKKDAIIRQFME